MAVMHITQADIEYMQEKLQGMNEGDKPSWSIRDRAVVSRLLIILQEHPDHVVELVKETEHGKDS